MKHLWKLTTLLAAVLCLTACDPDEMFSLDTERDITYIVSDGAPASCRPVPAGRRRSKEAFQTTVHLKTEAEWQELLEQFCNWAEGGSTVTFYGAPASSRPVPAGCRHSKDATTFSTTSREEMKAWMAQMEDEGMTVTVSYDSATGTWNGTAYATAPQPQPQPQVGGCHTGVLTYAPMHTMEEGPVPPGLVWALQAGDTTFWLVTGGHFITANDPTLTLDSVTYAEGDTVTLCGRDIWNEDYNGNYFHCLILDDTWNYPTPWTHFAPVYIGYSDYRTFVMSIDTVNRLLYCTSTLADLDWQGAIGGGVIRYSETGETDGAGGRIMAVYGEANGNNALQFSLQWHDDGSLTFRDPNMHPADQYVHTLGDVQMQRTYDYETWVYEGAGYNVVFHLFCGACVAHENGFCSSPFYIDCPTPFRIGEFYLSFCDEGRCVWWRGDGNDQMGAAFDYEYHGDYQLLLTPADTTFFCDASWLFNRK